MGWGGYQDKNDASGVQGGAAGVTNANNIGDLAPGKSAKTGGLTAPSYTGDVGIDAGPLCEREPGNPDCFLTTSFRGRLLGRLDTYVGLAEQHYNIAATEVKFNKLLEKDPDMPVVVGIILDVISFMVISKLSKALTEIRNTKTLTEIVAADGPMGMALEAPTMDSKATAALKAVDERALVAGVGMAIGAAKNGAGALVKNSYAQSGEQRAEVQDFIAQLQRSATVGYMAMLSRINGNTTDGQLLVFFEAMNPKYHEVPDYVNAITDKVNRYVASKVMDVGRHERNHPIVDGAKSERVRRDVRVSWHTYLSRYPKELVFEHVDSPDAYSAPIQDEKPAFGAKGSWGGEGVKAGVGPESDSVYIVPAEFRDIALQRHRLAWGTEPEIKLIDDSVWDWDPPRARAAKAQKAAADTQSIAGSIPKLQLGKPHAPPVQINVPDIFKNVNAADAHATHVPQQDPLGPDTFK